MGTATTSTVPTYVPPSISVISIPLFTMAGTDLLNKFLTNWHSWKHQTTQHLMLCSLFGYLDGTIQQPDASTEAKAHQNWKMNDNAILIYFRLRAAEGKQEELKKAMSAKDT